MFTWQDEQTLLIAHIASPNSVANIRSNPNVCVSFVDVFVQKGFKLKGRARIIEKEHAEFPEKAKHLTDLFSDAYPIKDVIEVTVIKAEPIVAPSYFLFPETTVEGQIAAAHKTYKVRAE
jgi:predicted pyridoxine 5'-phosphate oxidase superfamily flavin-nucleotide-binding protein